MVVILTLTAANAVGAGPGPYHFKEKRAIILIEHPGTEELQGDRRRREKEHVPPTAQKETFYGRRRLEKSSWLEPFLQLLPGWSTRRAQPLRKLPGTGKRRHYLHATKVSRKGRGRRHFPQENVANRHTDQRFRYKMCLRREDSRVNDNAGAPAR